MSKMFGNLSTDGLEEAGDVIGGGALLETGIYDAIVKLAYVKPSQSSKATGVEVHLQVGGTTVRETFYITNRNGENFYKDKQDPSKQRPLPGFTSIDDLCLLTTGEGLTDQEDIEEKVVKLYDFEAKKDLPQTVPVLTGLLEKPVTIAVFKQTVDKQKKDASGNYVNTGETRDENVIEKFIHTDTRGTVSEIKNNLTKGTFEEKWQSQHAGKTRNRSKGAEGNAGAPGAAGKPGGAPAAAQKPKSSLFGS